MRFLFTSFLVGCSFLAFAQSKTQDWGLRKFEVKSFAFTAEISVGYFDLLSNETLPSNVATSYQFSAHLNEIIVWSNIFTSSESESDYELFVLSIGCGYNFKFGNNFQLQPMLGFSSGSLNQRFVTENTGLYAGVGINKLIPLNKLNNILVGVDFAYNYLDFNSNLIITSSHFGGVFLRIGYVFEKVKN